METLREIGADVTLENAYHLLLDERDLEEAMNDLATGHPTPRRRELVEHFRNRFLSQPPEQIGGVKETIANYLQSFITPEIAQVFCPARTPSTSPTSTAAKSSASPCRRSSRPSAAT